MKKLFRHLYFSLVEYDLYEAIQQTESRLRKLQSKIMNGDYKAASLAFEQLQEYDKLKVEFEERNFNN